GIIPPRDTRIGPADISFTETKVSPKLAVTFAFPTRTTLRAAGYYRLSPTLGRVQTVEPPQVAGFNQFFDDPGGPRALSYGAGIDQAFGRRLFAGGSVLRRELTIPEAFCDAPNRFAGCATQPATHIVSRDSTDYYADAYVSALVGSQFAVSAS